MLEVIKIADIILDNPLFVEESLQTKYVSASSLKTLGGSRIVYEQLNRNSALNYTLVSKDFRWLKEETIKNILAVADDLDVVVPVYFKDGSHINCRFRFEDGEVIKADELFEGSDWFKVEIKLARVE